MTKILIALVAVTALASLFLLQSTAPTAAFEAVSIPSQVQESFEQWMVKQGKTQDSPTDKLYRLSVQNANLKRIVEHNNAGKSWTLTNNQFADLTAAEFSELQLGLKVNKNAKKNQNLELLKETALPTSVDWRKEGAVTPIKNQGQCGSCWAFSTTGGLEGIHFLTTKNLTSFSEQQLVDCSDSQGNMGCEGGLMDQALEQTAVKGIEGENTQPQRAVDGTCKQNANNVLWKNAGHQDVPQHSVTALLTQSALSPVSIGVDAEEWQFQEGGVQSGDCGEELDHGVLLVGQEEGSSAQQIVKNSWGEEWGENGQIRLALNKKNQAVGGMCGILNTATVPTA